MSILISSDIFYSQLILNNMKFHLKKMQSIYLYVARAFI